MSTYPNNISSPSFLVHNILNQQWSDPSLLQNNGSDYPHSYYSNYDSRLTDLYTANPACVYGTSPPPISNHQPTYTTLSTHSVAGLPDGHQIHTDTTDSGNQSSTDAPLLTPKSEEGEMVEVLEKRKLSIIVFKRKMSERNIPLIPIKSHLIRPLLNIY